MRPIIITHKRNFSFIARGKDRDRDRDPEAWPKERSERNEYSGTDVTDAESSSSQQPDSPRANTILADNGDIGSLGIRNLQADKEIAKEKK